MKITLDNTRALGIGETVLPDDWSVDRDGFPFVRFQLVDRPEVGKIITEDEQTEYRRLIGSNPYESMHVELDLKNPISKEFFNVLCECAKLFDEKQTAYGMENVRWLGEYGVNLRVGEKTMRIKNLLDSDFDPQTETIEDSWKDIINLAAIGLMVRRNLWK